MKRQTIIWCIKTCVQTTDCGWCCFPCFFCKASLHFPWTSWDKPPPPPNNIQCPFQHKPTLLWSLFLNPIIWWSFFNTKNYYYHGMYIFLLQLLLLFWFLSLSLVYKVAVVLEEKKKDAGGINDLGYFIFVDILVLLILIHRKIPTYPRRPTNHQKNALLTTLHFTHIFIFPLDKIIQ